MSSEQVRFERMIRSVSELPKPSPGLHKRVLRQARRAEKDRTTRIRWTLGLCAAAFLLLIGVYSYPPRNAAAPGGMPYSQQQLRPGENPSTEADWRFVEDFEREREIQSGFIRGSF